MKKRSTEEPSSAQTPHFEGRWRRRCRVFWKDMRRIERMRRIGLAFPLIALRWIGEANRAFGKPTPLTFLNAATNPANAILPCAAPVPPGAPLAVRASPLFISHRRDTRSPGTISVGASPRSSSPLRVPPICLPNSSRTVRSPWRDFMVWAMWCSCCRSCGVTPTRDAQSS